jgi:hypothetical protein
VTFCKFNAVGLRSSTLYFIPTSFSDNLLFFSSSIIILVLHYFKRSCTKAYTSITLVILWAKHHTWTDRCFSIKIISHIGLLKVVEFMIKFVRSLPSTSPKRIYKSTFHYFFFFILAFSRTIKATSLAHLAFSPFSCAI